MHELSICEGIIHVLEEQSVRQGFRRIQRVRLEIGPMSGVEIASLRFCFDVAARGSVAENATLEILEPPGRAECLECGKVFTIRKRFGECPACGGYRLHTSGGDELRIRDLEVQ